ncbi:MAG TPA: hypothetical protein VK831_04100 [Candidatus Deferrimicrobiaceae bacterium]|nr:hypothetical protein [Candidatus Deferrimicrobiaceae bacterium]
MATNGTPGPASRAFARLLGALATIPTLLALGLALAAPVLAQEADHGGPVPPERRLLAIGILIAFVGLMLAWAWLYRRVNRA